MSNAPTTGMAKAAKAEALAAEAAEVQTTSVEWRGQNYVFTTNPKDWPVDVSEAFEDGKAIRALRYLLGDRQWAEFKKLKPTNADLDELFGIASEAMGLDSGE